MASLTRDQLEFLQHHNVPLWRVYDASVKSRSSYTAAMSALELWVAYGVTPCAAGGHELRDRAGHCVQCKPANLSYQRRYDEEGEVYVAQSVETDHVKVGTASDAQARVKQLNYYLDCVIKCDHT